MKQKNQLLNATSKFSTTLLMYSMTKIIFVFIYAKNCNSVII